MNNPVVELCRDAAHCRTCFGVGGASPSKIDIAQPRVVGRAYWEAAPRICVLMLNPGAGEGRIDTADARMRELLVRFRDNLVSLDEVFQHQHNDMPNWGRGRFWTFYVHGMGLNPTETAFANLAWCGVAGDKPSGHMRRTCFEKFTRKLLLLLNPDIVVASGADVRSFAPAIQQALPRAHIVQTLHYAHREGRAGDQAAFAQMRAATAAWSQRSEASGGRSAV